MLQNLYNVANRKKLKKKFNEKYQRKQNVQKLLDKQQLNVLKYV